MRKPRICVTVVDHDLKAVKEVEALVDLFELRLDLIGERWPEVSQAIKKPWIACNRSRDEGGRSGDETARINELTWAAEAGACYVDIELRTPRLSEIVPLIKARAKCIISYHDMAGTPSYDSLVQIAQSQLNAGADICKIVTTARDVSDNWLLLKLLRHFPETEMVTFAMGEAGQIGRVLCPLAGGSFTYACAAKGKESASGQITAAELRELYGYLR